MFFRIKSKANTQMLNKSSTNNSQMHAQKVHFSNHLPFRIPGKVWRSTIESPETTVLNSGFNTHGKNNIVQYHVENNIPSIYLSYGNSMLDAMRFCKPIHYDKDAKMKLNWGSYLYLTNLPEIHINIKEVFLGRMLAREANRQENAAERENEMTGIGRLPFENIYMARRYLALPSFGVPYMFSGPLLQNAIYQARNWSIMVPSASSDEAATLNEELHKIGYIKPTERFLTLDEAIEIAAALKEKANAYEINFAAKTIIFDKVPSNYNSSQALDLVLKKYVEHNEQQNNIYKKTSTVMVSTTDQTQKSPWLIASEMQEKANIAGKTTIAANALFGQNAQKKPADEKVAESNITKPKCK